jgi:thioredoxin-dependent peroxiredoxin
MKFSLLPAVAALAFCTAPAFAALPVGATAPEISTQAALGGREMPFDLKVALKSGPVVLYFYPKSFTQGCTLEAHAFSAAASDFTKLGATVIGLSADEMEGDEGLKKFSTVECRDKFAVGVATSKIIADYDAKLAETGRSNRTSYVIAPNGRILMAYSSMDWQNHVEKAMDAVKQWKASHKG